MGEKYRYCYNLVGKETPPSPVSHINRDNAILRHCVRSGRRNFPGIPPTTQPPFQSSSDFNISLSPVFHTPSGI